MAPRWPSGFWPRTSPCSVAGSVAVFVAAALVSFLLLVTCDLDRPHRGLIQVPDTALVNLRESMDLPPAAAAPD